MERRDITRNLSGARVTRRRPVEDMSALASKFGGLLELSAEEQDVLEDMQAKQRTFDAKSDVFLEGDEMVVAHVVRSGWGIRYRALSDGRRQILNFVLPGDIVGMHVSFRRHATFGFQMLTKAELAIVEESWLDRIYRQHPILAAAMSWSTVREFSVLGEHVVRLGRRSAFERMAHLLLEIRQRLDQIGLDYGGAYRFPVTQVELADTLGLTPVHVSRTLRRLKGEGLVETQKSFIVLKDIDRLTQIAHYDPAFLESFALN